MKESMKMEIKKELLNFGESTARNAVETTFNLIEYGIKDSENKIDDMLLGALPALKEIVLKLVDKIYVEDAK